MSAPKPPTHVFVDSGLRDGLNRRLCTCEAPESNRRHAVPDHRAEQAEHRRRLGDREGA